MSLPSPLSPLAQPLGRRVRGIYPHLLNSMGSANLRPESRAPGMMGSRASLTGHTRVLLPKPEGAWRQAPDVMMLRRCHLSLARSPGRISALACWAQTLTEVQLSGSGRAPVHWEVPVLASSWG